MILTLNAGSSSLKFALFEPVSGQVLRRCSGQLTAIGDAARLRIRDQGGQTLFDKPVQAGDQAVALTQVLAWCDEWLAGRPLSVAGHRVVHGGNEYIQPQRIDTDVLVRLQQLAPLAPLHQPHNLAAIETLASQQPKLLQVACFDTAFHHTQPMVARRFALPRAMHDAGIHRYGFHGLSCEYLNTVLPNYLGADAEGKVVIAHLGNGASLTAVQQGRSVATTMGFTPLDGLVMGSRCGAIDPGVLLHLLRHQQLDADDLEELLARRSGLLGVSGISSDMAVLLKSDRPEAAEAIELFVYRVGRELGSMAAAMGGLDALIFTGGIGEHAAVIRARIVQQAAWLGVVLNEEANATLRGDGCISAEISRVVAWVMGADEEQVIAAHSWRLATLTHP